MIALTMALVNVTIPLQTKASEYAAINLALGKSATSSNEHNKWPASKAFDGIVNRNAANDDQSRWSSEAAPLQWIQVDLGSLQSFDEIQIAWEKDAQKAAKFKIEVSSDGTNYTIAHDSANLAEGHPLDTNIKFDQAVSGRYVKLSVESLIAGAWASVSIYEMKVLQNYENLALAGTMSANGHEDNAPTLAPDRANDASFTTRWASTVGINQKWLQVDLGSEKTVRSVALAWERKNATKYKIQTSIDSNSWSDQAVRDTAPSAYRDIINFDADVQARYVRVLIDQFVATGAAEGSKSITWETVSIFEFEVYGQELIMPEKTVSEVASSLRIPALSKDDTKLTMPAVPNGFDISFIGADYEQLIDADLNVHHPLTDRTVKVNFEVKKGNETAISPDMNVTIPGQFENVGTNPKPIVVPELAEWVGYTGNFTISDTSKIILATGLSQDYQAMANEFANDYQEITGNAIAIERGDTCTTGNFCFVKETSDTMMGDEGYRINIEDAITISSIHQTGAYWSTRSILQILKQNGTTIPKGITRDYPKYKVRGFMLDVGRKPFSMEYIQSLSKNMAWYKMNDLQLHLNDNFIWIERYLQEGKDPREEAYSAFRMESSYIGPENGKALTATDQYYKKDEFRQYIKDARVMGVNIVPEFDTPAHSLSFTRVRPDLSMQDHNVRRWSDHLDLVSNYDASLSFIKEIFNEYMEGQNPVFDEQTIIGVGTDEYEGNYRAQFRRYTGDMLDFVKDTGRKVRLWGSLGNQTSDDASGQQKLDPSNVQMSMWSNSYANPQAMMKEGFHMINMNEHTLYMVPGANYYGDYLNQQNLYTSYNVADFGGNVLPAGSPLIDGAEFAVWNDYVDLFKNGISEYEITKRVFPVITAMSERLWGDAQDKTYAQFSEAVASVNEAPGVNMKYEIETAGDDVINYEFNDEADAKKDSSGNDFHGTQIQNAQITSVDGKSAIELKGQESYMETPLQDLKPNFELSFKVKRMSDSNEEQILFESDKASIKAVQKETGKVGYSRDFYDYSFDYILPVGVWHTLKIQSVDISTKLYVDGVLVDEIIGTGKGSDEHSSIYNYPTLTMPLTRIGSQSSAFIGYLDDVVVSKAMSEDQLLYAQDLLTPNATSYYGSTGPDQALDGNNSTFWETYWGNGGTGGVQGSWPYSFSLTFKDGEEHLLGKLSYLPRQDNSNNGTITAYKVFAIKKDNSEIELVSDGSWANGKALKTIEFDAVSAKGIRIEVTGSMGDQPNTTANAAEFNLYAPETFETDKDQLNYLLTQAHGLTGNDYTTESFAMLEALINEATAVYDNANALQAEITEASKKLQTGMSALVEVKGLKQAIEAFEALQEADYEIGAYTSVKTMVDEAKALLVSGTKEELSEAVMQISAGIKALRTSILEKTIQAQASRYEENYTADSWSAYQSALHDAQAILDAGEDATLVQIDQAIVELSNKELALVLETVDKTALQALIAECNKLQEITYTPSSWVQLRTALTNAEAMDQKNPVSVREIRLAYEALTNAKTSLLERGDIEGLQELLNTLDEAMYSTESWALFVSTYEEAQVLIAKGNEASADECNDMVANIEEAAKQLVKISTNQKALEEEIKVAQQVDPSLYIVDSMELLKQAIKTAEDMFHSQVSEEEYLIVANELKAVREALILRGDVVLLQQKIIELQNEALIESQYTVETWTIYETALSNAQAMVNDNSHSDQAAVDAMLVTLQEARNQLQNRTEIVETDKTELRSAIEEARGYQETDYLVSTWIVFKEALNQASLAEQSEMIVQEEVNAVVIQLKEAIAQLTKHGDASSLQALMDQITKTSLEETDYTKDSWTAYDHSLKQAQAVLNDLRAMTQAQVDEAKAQLETAYNALAYDRHTTKLEALLKDAEAIKETESTKTSYANMKAAYDDAMSIVNDQTTKQAVIDEAYTMLNKAMNEVIKRGDMDALQVRVKEASVLKKEHYTSDTWSILEEALKQANEALVNEDADQSMVDEAYKILSDAIKQLKEVPEIVILENKTNQITIIAPANIIDPNTQLQVENIKEHHALFELVKQAMADIADTYVAYDITLLLNDVFVQPNGTLEIRMAIPKDFDMNRLSLYYVDDEGNRTPIKFHIDGHDILFETDHFSVYVLSQKKQEEPTKPVDPVKPVEPQEPPKPVLPMTPETKDPVSKALKQQLKTSTPSTGDQTNTSAYVIFSMMALLGIGIMITGNVRNKKEE